MKRLIVIFTFILAMGLFTGCNGSDGKTGDDEGLENTEESQTVSFDLTGQIEEQNIYDQDGLVVNVLSLEVKDDKESSETTSSDEADSVKDSGPYLALNVYVENYGDRCYTVKSYAVAINGITVNNYDALGWCDVGCGGESYFILGDLDLLEEAGISDVAEISFELYISDADTWEVISKEIITIKTNLYGNYTQDKINTEGEVVYDENNIKIVNIGLDDESIYADSEAPLGPYFYIENNTDKMIVLTVGDTVTVNDIALDVYPTWSIDYLLPGACAYTGYYLSNDEWAEAGVTGKEDIKTISCGFQILDHAIWHGTNDEEALLFDIPQVIMHYNE